MGLEFRHVLLNEVPHFFLVHHAIIVYVIAAPNFIHHRLNARLRYVRVMLRGENIGCKVTHLTVQCRCCQKPHTQLIVDLFYEFIKVFLHLLEIIRVRRVVLRLT